MRINTKRINYMHPSAHFRLPTYHCALLVVEDRGLEEEAHEQHGGLVGERCVCTCLVAVVVFFFFPGWGGAGAVKMGEKRARNVLGDAVNAYIV